MKLNINGELTVKGNKAITNIDTVNDTTNGIMTSTMKKKLDGIEEGSQVNTITGIKGSNETEYRIGQINITKDNLGLSNVDNTSDASKPVSTATRTAIDEAYANSNRYTDKAIADLINGAPETMNTLKEVSDAINSSKSAEEALNKAIGTKANQAELDGHTGNNTIHITADERKAWNAKQSTVTLGTNTTSKATATFSGTFTVIDGVTRDANGHVTQFNTKTITMPANPNTWRGIQDNLTSTSTSDSLSANQGKVLKGLIDGKAAASHTHTIANITNLQSTLDGKASANHTHDDRYYTESEINTKLNGKANSSHTHTIANITNLQTTLDGKASTSHNHDGTYLKISGGTMTGALNLVNNAWNAVGDDVAIGDHDVSGSLGVKGLNATPKITFFNSSNNSLANIGSTAANVLETSATSFKIGGGCTLQYDSINKCVNFVFA